MTPSNTAADLALYDLEGFIFNDVAGRYHAGEPVSAFDFFCIVIWKANRAKSKIAKRLLAKSGASDLDLAVATLIREVREAPSHEERLRVLISDWGFLLPMASSILTVFYPEDFTVYDYRVVAQLRKDNRGEFQQLGHQKFDRLWGGYLKYVSAVRESVPDPLSLRDKDRVLWARSFRADLEEAIRDRFAQQEAKPGEEPDPLDPMSAHPS